MVCFFQGSIGTGTPNTSHTTPIRIPKDMGMVWEAYHKGVLLLGVPGITLDGFKDVVVIFYPDPSREMIPNLTIFAYFSGKTHQIVQYIEMLYSSFPSINQYWLQYTVD